ncbi:MAG: ATP-dependent Clp protease ATP-binding subunit, partial [Firmicutes bacterium]|nr:ATP-dependent Clp protease ATP-binding subunit [Bacillota bacterium]
MKPTLCSRCKKNLAVVFITKIDGGKTVNEGLCLKCAKEMGIKPVDDMIERMGLSEDDLENLNGEMTEAMNGLESLLSQGHDAEDGSEDDEADSQTATFPFLNKLFGAAGQGQDNTPAVPEPEKTESRQRSGDKPNPKNKKHKFLDTYCQNLTQKARDGKLDRIIGREEETERVIQILNRRQKNNPCLIGEPGVGKTAIAEGLAQKIADKDVPYKLQNKEVYLMDLTALVAGTQFRGQFESRMKGLIEEVKKLGNIILVIDEVHNLVGAGDAEGSMNAANILKPALSRGEIQVIGATTFNEYRKHIEKDAALERRFQPVTVAEPTIEQSIAIIRGISHYYETFHGVVISPEIARQAVLLSERYITDRFLPDKAIDLIDEACSDVNLKNKNIGRLEALKKEHADYDLELSMLTENAEKTQDDYARMAELRSRNLQLDSEIAELEKLPKPALTIDNLARIIELWTKIPASKIRAQEYEQLLNLDAELKKHIVGQDEAIASVVSAIRRSRVGIQVKKHPVSFIFVGSTGVGKTELVKRLASEMFESVESLIRLDMSEYMEKHSVSKIIGSPPGYVGYDEAGQLTEKIRRRPYSVILFDELEKAHPDVLNILLQILDDGRITDAQGRVVNFENTIIIMTSNAGSNQKGGSVGFGRSLTEQSKEKAMKALGEFVSDKEVCVNGLNAFRRMMELRAAREEVMHAGVSAILAAMRRFEEEKEVQQYAL